MLLLTNIFSKNEPSHRPLGGSGGDSGCVQGGEGKGICKGSTEEGKRSFAQMVSSDSSVNSRSLKSVARRESAKRMSKELRGDTRLSGAKHP